MGRSSLIVRWAFIFIAVSLIAGLAGCSSSSPTRNTNFPTKAKIGLAPATPVSLDAGSRHPDLYRYPTEQQGYRHHHPG